MIARFLKYGSAYDRGNPTRSIIQQPLQSRFRGGMPLDDFHRPVGFTSRTGITRGYADEECADSYKGDDCPAAFAHRTLYVGYS